MPPKSNITCGGLTFTSKTKLEQYAKSIKNKIGLTDSVKKSHPDDYNFFLDLFKRHPKYNEKKLIEMVDIFIKRNHTNDLALYFLKEDGTTDDISIYVCAQEKEKDDFKIAMRDSIDDQIRDFREKNVYRCARCYTTDKSKQYDVDHIHEFEKLKKEFLETTKLPTPTEFQEGEDHQKVFLPIDNDFEKSWQSFHKENARLRILCAPCHKTRAKWDT
jgi:hypothetical protein